MMLDCNCSAPASDEKVQEGFRVVKQVLEDAHQGSKALIRTKDIRTALRSDDYGFCLQAAQECLKQNRRMLDGYEPITGVSIIDMTWDEAYEKDIDYWKQALRYTEMVIYADEVVKCGLKHIVEEKLKKIFCC